MELYKEVLKDGFMRLHDAFSAMERAVRDADDLGPDDRSDGLELLDLMRNGCFSSAKLFRQRFGLDVKE